MTYKKKLIEVALPLEAINIASAREKSIRHGHPSTLHLWWARRPLAAARAVIFAQMVDDPSAHPDIFKTEKAQEKERQRLFRIIEDLVLWENTTNEVVLQKARDEIWQSWRYTCAENADHPRAKELFDRFKLPAFHDPFAGGGALPLEAQRLGLESYASDLNPVAVLINKAMIEIPPRFAGKPPVNPDVKKKIDLAGREWKGAQGLAEDVRYYGQWMRKKAESRIGQLYPEVEITEAMAQQRPDLKKYIGQKLTVIAWLWVRTVNSSNPAFADVAVPLASTFMLSTKPGKEAYVEPVIEGANYYFNVKVGKPKNLESARNGTKLARGANFRCLMSNTSMAQDYVRGEFQAKRSGMRLMAIVVSGERERVYLSPTIDQDAVARSAIPDWRPEQEMNQDSANLVSGRGYGITHWHEIFTHRQLVALTTFTDLVQEARERVMMDAIVAGLPDDGKTLDKLGAGAAAYADAVSIYLAFAVSKMSNIGSSITSWMSDRGAFRETFARQAIPMTWDFAEANTFADIGGSFSIAVEKGALAIDTFPASPNATAAMFNASSQTISINKIISTDPPYYDNIAYADLSDFFYIWLRCSLKPVFPELFTTLAVPKAEELVATPYRHGGIKKAETFFLEGMTQAMHRLAEQAHPAFPVTIYYAFKQVESDGNDGLRNTGWDTFLGAVVEAGFAISGTWPVRTEGSGRMIAFGNNALASSIVLVCRKRPPSAVYATRREFISALKAELPQALIHLQAGNIAPVDLAQAAIGPGMSIYTRYSKVMDAEGQPLSVHAALMLINQVLDESLTEQEEDFDRDSRFALAWFEQFGFDEGNFGVANVLATAKGTTVPGVVQAGIADSGKGKVRLLKPIELPHDWDPITDKRLTVWEMVHHLIRVLEAGGENSAAVLMAKLGSQAEAARELCYRLYTLCERKKRVNEAMAYNALVQSWPEIARLAIEKPSEASVTQNSFKLE